MPANELRVPEHLALIDDMAKIHILVEAAMALNGNSDERLVQAEIIGVISDITEKWVG
ncbi:hypothetical protein [Serratia ficaria]|uniref:hypothetical protein n=1 Tax=Serratia ficaria TaxID=61651 RepID=UPI000E36538B|nr:hypothetical protein [Serratia ficaria]REF42119.1 hypothetical protein C7332_0285 [Serratia ficaria]CAI1046561.1 Uncharacterised protein [Serratia ficaria]CAI1104623.1 Uncharacterised protein [Serratia ficaria]CAI1174467.1 Uncharacterised protein [Serratia ficaria]CAI1199564.1 Uncharacterised protein [Serratia ficaria]